MKVKDKDEIYTNGSELISVFRVKQWLEHITPIRPKGHNYCPKCRADMR